VTYPSLLYTRPAAYHGASLWRDVVP